MRKSLLLFFFFLLCITLETDAQQSPLMSHYMFNGLILNPAYAGSKEFVSSTLMYRKQWAGIDGAPVTYSGTIHGLIRKKKLGIGAILQQDKIGVTKQTDFYLSFAYHLPVGAGKLSVGIQGGFSNFASEVVDLTYWDPGDQVFNYNKFSSLLPNVGMGIYYYRDVFYAGLSAPMMLSYDKNYSFNVSSDNAVHHMVHRYYATAGGVFEASEQVKLKPSFLVKSEGKGPVQLDLNLNVMFNDIFWIGASYRTSAAVVALFEYQLNRNLRVGYSYDYTLNQLRNYTSGSHELMLRYDFGFDVIKMKSPRYF